MSTMLEPTLTTCTSSSITGLPTCDINVPAEDQITISSVPNAVSSATPLKISFTNMINANYYDPLSITIKIIANATTI
jgi:hypothetical protein